MRKSVAKRIKVSKTGKLLRRQVAIDHFRSKKSGKNIRLKRGWRLIPRGYEKQFQRYLTSRN